MLPTGDDAEIMEQSTLNQVFSLFGKGIIQMLQQSVNQQTVIDELRAQNRSLQSQVGNLTAALDEVEDRIFVRLQNMQPTLYTREGIPIDDALDTISSKVQSLNEKIVSNAEAITKVDAELTAKVDRDEFEKANNEAQKAGDSFGDLSNTIQTIQKDIQQIKQNAQDSNDRMMQTIKFQIKSQMLNQQMNTEEQDLTDYVTKDELREKLNKLKLEIANGGSGDQNDVTSIVDYAISGKGLTEEKVKEAYNLLQQRKANVDKNYSKQKKTINQEMKRLMRLAKNVTKANGEEFGDFEVEEEEEEKSENNKNSQQKIEFRTVGIDTTKDIFEVENTESREATRRKKKRNIGVTVKINKKRKNNSKETKENNDDDDDENDDEYNDDESTSENNKSKQKDEKGLDNLIDKMQEEQEQDIQQQQQQINAHVDEGKLIQKVLEAVMPRVESLFESLSTTSGNGIKLEKNEAKQLLNQLSLLDSVQNEMKNLRMKVNMKFDRSTAETELQLRITKDEFFSYLAQLFPENETLKRMAPHPKSKLPPLNNARSSSSMSNANANAYSNTTNKNMTSSSTAASKNTTTTTNKNATITTNNNNKNTTTPTNNSSMNSNASSNSFVNDANNSNLSNTYNNNAGNNNNMIFNNGLNNTNNSNISNSYSNKNGLAESQKVVYTKNSKPNKQGKMVMKPTRNSNMIMLNQKFLKGADGHYYLRDTGSDSNEISASMFGTDKVDDADINAAFDFQPFRRVEESSNVVKNIREETPNDE